METVKYMLEVPKEGKEIIDATSALIAHFINGGSIAEAAVHLPKVMEAVNGAGGVMEEMKSKFKDELAGYSVHKMWESFEKVPAETVPADGSDQSPAE